MAKQDALKDSELGFLVSSTLHKLEHISDRSGNEENVIFSMA